MKRENGHLRGKGLLGVGHDVGWRHDSCGGLELRRRNEGHGRVGLILEGVHHGWGEAGRKRS